MNNPLKVNRSPETAAAGWKEGLRPFVLLFFAVLVCTFFLDQTENVNSTAVLLAGGIAVTAYLVRVRLSGQKISQDSVLALLFLVCFLLRLYYVLITDVSLEEVIRQQDVGTFGMEGGTGHEAYIEWFYNHPFRMPDTVGGLFYHPPLHHWLAAMWMKALTTIGMSYARAVTSLQYLTLFYSCCCQLVVGRILSALEVKGTGKTIACALTAFHPQFMILAGSVNNDVLSVLFVLITVDLTIRWIRQPSMGKLLGMALSIGLGMSTKLSAALIAIPVGIVMLIHLFRSGSRRLQTVKQYCLFALVCVPLGLWHSIWKFIQFGQSPTYVTLMPDTLDQYVGNYSVWERLLDYSYHPFSYVYLRGLGGAADYYEYNPFVAIAKTSVFGEYYLGLGKEESVHLIAAALLWCNILLMILAFAAMIFCAVRMRRKWGSMVTGFLVFYDVLTLGYYLVFCFQYPHTCSMNFRYIAPTCVLGAVFLGGLLEQAEEVLQRKAGASAGQIQAGAAESDLLPEAGSKADRRSEKFEDRKGAAAAASLKPDSPSEQRESRKASAEAGIKLAGAVRYLIVLLVVLFCIFSAAQYILVGLWG